MWAAIINIVLGLWVMLAPGLLGYNHQAGNNCYIVAPLVITFATTAVWEVNRNVRYLNVPLGIWLAAAPFILDHTGISLYNDIVIGITIAALSMFKGTIKGKYGGGWIALLQKRPLHSNEIEIIVRK